MMFYTEKEKEIIESHAANMTVDQLAELLPGRKAVNVQLYLHRNNIKYKHKDGGYEQKLNLTKEQEKFIDQNHPTMNIVGMANALGVGFGTVRKYVIRKGYKSSRCYRKLKERRKLVRKPKQRAKNKKDQPMAGRSYWPAQYSNTNWETYLIND